MTDQEQSTFVHGDAKLAATMRQPGMAAAVTDLALTVGQNEELIQAVIAQFDRDQHVATWPEDERDFFRNPGGWTNFSDRHEKLQRIRAAKIIAAVRAHDQQAAQ